MKLTEDAMEGQKHNNPQKGRIVLLVTGSCSLLLFFLSHEGLLSNSVSEAWRAYQEISCCARGAGQVKYESRCWICICIVFAFVCGRAGGAVPEPSKWKQNAVRMFLTKLSETHSITWHQAAVSSCEIYVCGTPPCSLSGFCRTTSEI